MQNLEKGSSNCSTAFSCRCKLYCSPPSCDPQFV